MQRFNKQSFRRAFTLVEMLVVMGIIVILGGAVIAVVDSPGNSKKIRTTANTINTLIQAARTTALMKNTTTRLIINNDPTDRDRYLNFAGIIYEFVPEEDATSSTEEEPEVKWLALNQGASFSRGIYFMNGQGITGVDVNGIDIEDPTYLDYSSKLTDLAGGTMDLVFPSTKAQVGLNGTQWLYYEFSENGIAMPSTANKKFIISAGRRDGDVIVYTDPFQASLMMISLFGTTLQGDYDDL